METPLGTIVQFENFLLDFSEYEGMRYSSVFGSKRFPLCLPYNIHHIFY